MPDDQEGYSDVECGLTKSVIEQAPHCQQQALSELMRLPDKAAVMAEIHTFPGCPKWKTVMADCFNESTAL